MANIEIALIKKRFEASKQLVDPKLTDFQRWEDWYHCKLPKELQPFFTGEYSDKSALVPPLIHTCINDLRSKIVNAAFSIRPHFKLVNDAYPYELLQKNQELVMFQFDQAMEAYRYKLARQVLDWLLSGVGLKRVVWHRRFDPINGELIYEGPGFESISRYKFFPSGCWTSEGQLSHYIIQTVVHYGDLLDKAENGILEKAKVEAIPLEKFGQLKDKVDHYAVDVNLDNLTLTNDADKMVCPVLIWTYVDKNEVVTVANEDHELKRVENHDKLFNLGLSVLNLGAPDGEFYGKSAVDIIEDNFIEKFHKRNQRLDTANVSSAPQFITDDPNAPAIFKSGAGRIHKVSEGKVSDYIPIQFRESSDKGFIEDQLLTKDIEGALGLNAPFMGQTPDVKQTATLSMILQQNASGDLTFTIGQIEDLVIAQDILLMLHKNSLHFPDSPPVAYRGREIRRDEIVRDVQVKCLGMTQAVSQPVFASQITGLMDQWRQIPELSERTNWPALGRRQLDALKIPDPEEILEEDSKRLIPITKENYLLAMGVDVPVDPDEDHLFHDMNHGAFEESGQFPPQYLDLMQKHRQEHQMLAQQAMQGGGGEQGMITNDQGIVQRIGQENKQPSGQGKVI